MNDNMVSNEILSTKKEISNLMNELHKLANSNNFNLENDDEAFFIFLSKRIIFLNIY